MQLETGARHFCSKSVQLQMSLVEQPFHEAAKHLLTVLFHSS